MTSIQHLPGEIICLIAEFVFFPDTGSRYDDGITVRTLLLSTKRGNLAGVLRSLQYGANIETPDHTQRQNVEQPLRREYKYGVSSSSVALHWAAFGGNIETVDALLSHGANANARCTLSTRTTDGAKVDFGHSQFELFSYCISDMYWLSGTYARRRLARSLGVNALFFALKSSLPGKDPAASSANRLVLCRNLIESGSSLVVRTYDGLHALHVAAVCGLEDITDYLLTEGHCDPNVTDDEGDTALHYIGQKWSQSVPEAVIQRLQKNGADMNALNREDMTPLDLAVRHDFSGTSVRLLRHGAQWRQKTIDYYYSDDAERYFRHDVEAHGLAPPNVEGYEFDVPES
ncbi:methyltransferase domain-containing protein [Colletotrichum chrysophilum]|uniref:Methyltransferase domain-containing protein n=1 Tax=Colletotrichum chrysophilum TaxID=1836956 RepID=A0AAD9B1L6_9PEZI|nr:methyltransferase domain-containing protein [Colletotrichum chrysophilum]